MKITIIGAGMMASALTFPASENKHDIHLVGTILDDAIIDRLREDNYHITLKRTLPLGIKFYKFGELDSALENADLAIGGVSSFGVDWFGDYVLPRIPEETPILSVTKGLWDLPDGTLLCYPELWRARLAEKGLKRNLNAIGGPCTSYELVVHDHSEVTFCGDDMKTLEFLKSVMATSYYHISLSTNVVGIESAVALKNGYALAVALTIGLNQREFGIDSELHYNSQAGVYYQCVREMKKLLDIRSPGDFEVLAVGLGDLYVTVYGGRTRLVGILLGRGHNIDEAKAELNGVTLESLVVAERVARAVRVLAKAGKLDERDFPLLLHVDAILTEKKPADLPWEAFTYQK